MLFVSTSRSATLHMHTSSCILVGNDGHTYVYLYPRLIFWINTHTSRVALFFHTYRAFPLHACTVTRNLCTYIYSWPFLYRDNFTPVLLIGVSEYAGPFCESIGTKYRIPEHYPLVFFKLLQYYYIRHGIVSHA